MNNHDLRCDWIWGETQFQGNKPVADIYIDDRGLRFLGDWKQAMEAIKVYGKEIEGEPTLWVDANLPQDSDTAFKVVEELPCKTN